MTNELAREQAAIRGSQGAGGWGSAGFRGLGCFNYLDFHMKILAFAEGEGVLPVLAIIEQLEGIEEELTPEELEFARKGDCIWRTINGRRVCIIPRGTDAQRVARAKASYKPSTAAVQQAGDRASEDVSSMLGGKHTGNNEPVDVVVKIGTKLHGVEVKAFVHNSNDKVTVHPKSRKRKDSWAHRNKAVTHTVVVDVRSATRKMYYRRGHGSFRLRNMEQVGGATHLRQLMTGRS